MHWEGRDGSGTGGCSSFSIRFDRALRPGDRMPQRRCPAVGTDAVHRTAGPAVSFVHVDDTRGAGFRAPASGHLPAPSAEFE